MIQTCSIRQEEEKRNSQGGDPSTRERNSQSEDPSTSNGSSHKVERRVQKKQKAREAEEKEGEEK